MLRIESPHDARYARALLHLYTLSVFAVSQPLFDRLSGHVTYLIDHGLTGGILALLAMFLVLIVPTLLSIVLALVRAVRPQWQRRMHSALVCVLLIVIACPVARHVAEHEPLTGWGVAGYLVMMVALGMAVPMTMAYVRTDWFPRWVSWASPAIVLFPAAFLLASPAATALFPEVLKIRPVHSGRPVPVVLVVFDEFCGMSLLNEEHRIDPVRYPQFARLAGAAAWYRNATTVHPRTSKALPAILSGSLAHGANRPATEAEYPHNLFRVLQDSGQFEFVIFETVGRFASRQLNREPPAYPAQALSRVAVVLPTLSSVYLRAVFPTGLPVDLPQIPPEWYGLTSDYGRRPVHGKGAFSNPWIGRRDAQCDQFLACLDKSRKPCLSFIHVCLPHYPWCYLPSGRRHLEDRSDLGAPLGGFGPHGEDWTDDELVVEHAWEQYLLQVGYVDRFIGQLQDRLQELGVFDECLLIVTADHGVSFLPGHSRREPDGANLPEILSIPLLIKYPRQRAGVVDDRNVESIDILPTIADVLDLELPFPVDGSSVRDVGVPTRPRKGLLQDNGELIVVDPEFLAKDNSVQRLIATFGTGTHDDRLMRHGLFPGLIGRRIDECHVVPGTGVEIERFPNRADDSEHSPEVVPCSVQGRIIEFVHRKTPLTLAVAVNGIIVGVTRTSRDPRISNRFAVMLPEAALSGDHDEMQLFAVALDDDTPVLEPCRITAGQK